MEFIMAEDAFDEFEKDMGYVRKLQDIFEDGEVTARGWTWSPVLKDYVWVEDPQLVRKYLGFYDNRMFSLVFWPNVRDDVNKIKMSLQFHRVMASVWYEEFKKTPQRKGVVYYLLGLFRGNMRFLIQQLKKSKNPMFDLAVQELRGLRNYKDLFVKVSDCEIVKRAEDYWENCAAYYTRVDRNNINNGPLKLFNDVNSYLRMIVRWRPDVRRDVDADYIRSINIASLFA